MLAARIKQMQAFFAVTQMFLMPMFFLSGALYPLRNLPTWLHVLTRINPMTYAVDPMRRAVFAHLDLGPVLSQLNPGVTWGSWIVPVWLELTIVLGIGLLMLAIGIAQFRRAE
jgi:ABC-2 type transport system permease protein